MNDFQGFEPANTTPVPDVLFDELLSQLNGSELKVLLYIIRRTLGFKKGSDAISLTQFQKGITTQSDKVLDKGCGISDRATIVKALESLETRGCIDAVKSKTAKGDSAITLYQIRFKPSSKVVGKPNQGSGQTQPPAKQKVVGKPNQGSMANPTRVVGKPNPQETVLQLNSLQETEKTTTDADASQQSQSSPQKEKISAETKPLKEKKAAPPRTRKQPELPHIDEPDLSVLSEQEKKIYLLLRKQDQPIYLSWRPTQRNVYNNWMGVFGNAMAVDITEGIVRTVERFESIQPTTENFLSIRKYAIDQEKNRPADKRYYKQRGFKLWDAAREWTGWKSQMDMIIDSQGSFTHTASSTMTHDDAIQLASDVVKQTKQHGYTSIQATAYTEKDAWLVKVVWEDGNPLSPIKSREDWNKAFKENYEMDQEDQKGAK